MKKRIPAAFLGMLLLFLLSGCGMRTVEEMYSLPRRSAQNNDLQAVVEASMEGMVYAAPVAGENQEPVQTADLDGDGRDEYLIFAKGEKNDSLQVLLFRQNEEGSYVFWESIECKGTSFEQIQYANIDTQPGCELVVGTRINEQITRIVSLYSFSSAHSEKIKNIIYQKFIVCDLDQDGFDELMVIQNGQSAADNGTVRLYEYTEGNVQGSAEVTLSTPADQIQRIAVNRLSSGESAVYVASSRNDSAVVTDIFAVRSGVFSNIAQLSEFGTSIPTLQNYYVYAEDINGDGILELPGLVPMMYNKSEQNLLRWYSLDVNGREDNRVFTFHNLEDGWYIELESEWIDRFAAEKNGNVYTFYMWNNSYGTAVPVFTVYAFTGRDRDSQASVQNRFPLYRGEDVAFAAKLESGSAIYGVSESYLQSHFHLIRQDWKTAES